MDTEGGIMHKQAWAVKTYYYVTFWGEGKLSAFGGEVNRASVGGASAPLTQLTNNYFE